VELRRSTDGVTWTDPVITDLGTADPYPWHIDVEWIASRGEFWAVYNVKIAGSCTTAALHFATSTDGLAWNPASSPVLVRGEIPAFADIVYRAAISYDPASQLTTLFYSGARFEHGGYTWRVATERLALDAFLRRLAAVTPGEGTSVTSSPPLTDETAP
jgi:hypothetical protein